MLIRNPLRVLLTSALLCAAGASLATPTMAEAVAPPVNVVELVNFACPHCRAEAQYTPQISAATRAQGGVFRIAPIGPQKGRLPVPAVFIYYAAASTEHNDSEKTQAIAQALYDGYKAQADLANDHGVLSWLQTQIPTIPYAAIQQQLSTDHPEKRFDKAAWLAIKTSASALPTFVYLSVTTGTVIGIDQWQGKASDLTRRVLDHVGANR
jgi:thiol-disulfide isomerase/thioredoxin